MVWGEAFFSCFRKARNSEISLFIGAVGLRALPRWRGSRGRRRRGRGLALLPELLPRRRLFEGALLGLAVDVGLAFDDVLLIKRLRPALRTCPVDKFVPGGEMALGVAAAAEE